MKQYKRYSTATNLFLFVLGQLIVWFTTHSVIACLGAWVAALHFDYDDILEQMENSIVKREMK